MAGYIHWPLDLRSHEETRVAKIQLTTIAKIVPHTPPPPKPLPKPSIVPPSITTTTKGSKLAPRVIVPPIVRTPTPGPASTPTPQQSPTAAPSAGPCGGHKDAEPALQATPEPAGIPPEARAAKVSGTAEIKVSLDPQGRVIGTAIARSSGDAGLDAVADKLARAATYSPKYIDCKGVAGEFVFSVHFSAL